LPGLYLAPPHGALLFDGKKRSVAKAHPLDGLAGNDLTLVSGPAAFGTVRLGEPETVSLEEFDARFEEHRVWPRERERWWPGAQELLLYPVEQFEPFEEPKPVAIPNGVQTLMSEVQFADAMIAEESKDYHSGVAIMAFLPAISADRIVLNPADLLDGGDVVPSAELHLTLAYLGDVEEFDMFDRLQIAQVVQDVAKRWPPLMGQISGLGRFWMEEPGLSPFYASFDSPSLPAFRQDLVDSLQAAGYEVDHTHGYTPHITLAYLPDASTTPRLSVPLLHMMLPDITIGWGDQQTKFDFQGDVRMFADAGFKSFTDTQGRDWLLTWTTNAFEDREGEIFTTQSIEDYTDRHVDDDVKGQYWFWHIPGTAFGDILWQGVSGRFLVEAGVYHDTPWGKAMKQFLDAYPEGHPAIAPTGWGCSHGYVYNVPDRRDKVYDWFEKRETSVLPLRAASNPYTRAVIAGREVKMGMSPKQIEALKAIGSLSGFGGDALVEYVQETGERRTKELEDAGVAFKAGPAGYAGAIRNQADAPGASEAKTDLLSLADKVDTAERAGNPLTDLADNLKSLADGISDQGVSDRLAAIADEMAAEDVVAPVAEAPATKAKKPPVAAADAEDTGEPDEANQPPDSEDTSETDETPAAAPAKGKGGAPPQFAGHQFKPKAKELAAEVAEELQLSSLDEALKSLSESNAQLASSVKAMSEEIQVLKAQLAESQKDDEQRLAEKTLNTPRFSWYRASQAAETVLGESAKDLDLAKKGKPRAASAIEGIASIVAG
jgi:2'-5' RNA ligase